MRRYAVLFLTALVLLGNGPVPSQQSPQAPQIQSKQQSKSALKDEEKSKAQANEPPSPMAGIPPPHSQSSSNETQYDAEQSGDEVSEFWTIFGRRLKVTDSLLVAFTALLFIATLLLWWSTRKLVKGAEDTARRQLRAYVLVSKVEMVNIYVGPEDFQEQELRIEIKNFGQTPATAISYWLGVQIREQPLRSSLTPNTPIVSQSVGVIAPSDTFRIHTRVPMLDETFDPSQSANAFYVYGEFWYTDAFNIQCPTPFRYMRRGGEDWTRDGELELCQGGNDPT